MDNLKAILSILVLITIFCNALQTNSLRKEIKGYQALVSKHQALISQMKKNQEEERALIAKLLNEGLAFND